MSKTNHDEQLDDLGKESISEHAVDRYEAENGSAIAVRSLDDVSRLSKIFIQSGVFKSDEISTAAQQVYQAGVKIIAGVEFGIQPFAAMKGLHLINGNVEMSANLMAGKIKRHPKYEYRTKKWDNDGCILTFFELPYPGAPREKWDELGDSSFNAEDARTAELSTGRNAKTWRKFARNMYFARAMSNGVRIYAPDIFYGAPVYVEGEISGEFEDKSNQAPAESSNGTEDTKPEPVEGEVVVGDEPANGAVSDPLQEKLDQIHALAKELGHGDDWFVHVSTLVNTVDDAEQVYVKLKAKQAEKVMSDE